MTNALEYIYAKYKIAADAPSPISLQVCRVPDQVALYAELGLKVGAEIGVDRGLFSQDICQANPGVKLFGVDPWQDYPEYAEVYTEPYSEKCRVEAIARLAPYDVTLIRKKSMDALADFGDDSLDFVYIDGNHAYEFVKDDITGWSRKVRPGGIISGHDYCRPKNPARRARQGVIQAVNEYVAENKILPWFIFRGSKCSGYFWVKA